MDSVCPNKVAFSRALVCTFAVAFLAAGVSPVGAQTETYKVGSFTKSSATTAVAHQNSTSAAVNSSTSVTITSFDPGSGSNRLLVVGLQSSAVMPSLAVTYGGVALTLVPNSSVTNGATHTEFWYLVNPSSTAANIVASWTGNLAVVIGASAFNNVDQAFPIHGTTTATGSSRNPTVTVSTMANDMTMAIAAKITNLGATTQTQRWLNTSVANIKGFGSTAATTAGVTSVTHTSATAGITSTVWSASGISIKQAGGQTQSFAHNLGQTPSAILMWTSGSTATGFNNSDWSAFGMSDGTTSYSTARSSANALATPSASRRAAAKALTIVEYGELLHAEAAITSWDATNVNLTWTSNSTEAFTIHFLALGGLSAKVLTWTPTAGTGNKSVTGVGFQPNVVFHMGDLDNAALPSTTTGGGFMLGVMDADGKQWVTSINGRDGTAPSDTARAQRTDACIEEITAAAASTTRASWVSMDANGFTLNYTANGAQNKMYSLAIAGLNAQVGTFNKSAAAVAPAFVQQASKNGGATASTTQAFPGVSTSGNLIVVTVVHDSATQTIQSVTDTKGNTYNLAVGPTNWGPSNTVHTSTYYASNIVGGGAAITVTVTLTGASTSALEVYQLEYSGVAAVNPLDQVSSAINTSVSPASSGAQTTTFANELIYGFAASTTGGMTAGAGFTGRAAADGQIAGDKTVAATGSNSYTATFAGTKTWVAHMATFRGGGYQAFTGLGFTPTAMLFASAQDITRTTPVAEARLGLGAGDGTNQFTTSIQDQDAAATTRVRNFDRTTKVFGKINNNTSTVDAEADLLSLDADGFSLNWTTNDAVATEMLYVAFAPMWLSEVKLTSVEATRYDSGVLVQWRTGYEVDNLGFNLYREINGVRTRVNTLPIKGSGIQAGSGGIVASEHSYARWDLDAAAADPGATYWLEDVEFNGKSTLHGPIVPAGSALQAPDTEDSRELDDLWDATLGKRILITYNEDPATSGPRAAPQVQPEMTTQWDLAGQASVKIGIRKPGWYRISQPELVAAGLGAGIDPRTLQLFVNGTELAIRVSGESDGAFDAGDAIEFYGSGADTPYTDTRTYWLRAGAQTGRRAAVAAAGPFAATPATGYQSSLRRKERSIYFAALRNGDAENWFGSMIYPAPAVPDPFNPFVPAEVTLTADHIDRAVGGDAQLTVALQGVTNSPDGTEPHRVGVSVNGTSVGEMAFTGQARAEQTFAVPAALLADGDNTVRFEAGASATDTSLVDVVRLTYAHTYQADADRLRFSVDAPAAVTVAGFAGTGVRVFDITDRRSPVELPAALDASSPLASVTVNVPGTGSRTLIAFSSETVFSPDSVSANQTSALHAAGNAFDYVVVSHRDFINEVAPLAAARQQQGHQTAVVDIDDVYDEFSFGEKTPQALKDFLQWAHGTWSVKPKFVVLAGDATIDPRDYEGLGNADFVPTKQVPMNQASLESASDDWFVDFGDNGLPEIAIGRLSVRTPQQAVDVVAKIVAYDAIGAAAWTKDVLLVADRNDSTADFERTSNALSAMLPAGYHAQTAYRGVLGDAPARQAIADGVNAGKLIVNYSGHGSTRIWGSNGLLLSNEDVPSFTNAGRLPFVVAMNCLNGLFNAIYDEDSLGEALLRAPNAGAVGVWASSSLTPSTTQALVNQELFRLIFSGTYATVGEAISMAKRVVANQDLRRSWVFFGDPAMRLSGAPQPAAADRPVITTQPQGGAIVSGQQRTLTVAASGAAPLVYRWFAGASGVTTSPIAGATGASYTTPALSNSASYWVRVSNPYGAADSAAAMLSLPLSITTPNPWPGVVAGTPYSLALAATETTAPYSWQAANLPAGLTINPATGEVAGTPTTVGTFSVVVRVADGTGASAQQGFILAVRSGADPLIDDQWHLRPHTLEIAGADVEPAWPLSRGGGVVIGIVDDGVQGDHPDLEANYDAALSYDFTGHDAVPAPATAGACDATAECEGTAAAGIAAAANGNGFGGSGVAPSASIAGIRLAAGAGDADEAAAFSHQLAAVQIENHSWHRFDNGAMLAEPGPLAAAALATAVSSGRSGAGRVFVWSAGDGGASGDNCNFDGYANSRYGIAVGAVDDAGVQPSYSESCSALFVSAPSSGTLGANRRLTTTDLAGEAGDDAGNYTGRFGGTAAAAPVVSGVAALMLARNPALTWRDVQHILVRSSRRVNTSDPGWTAGAFPHNEKYGFGVVDALSAVGYAATWKNVAPERAVRATTHTVGAAIPDNDATGIGDSIAVGSEYANFSVEHVEVEFTAGHARRGDLEVTLTSPAGVVSHLGTARPADTGANFAGWRFRSVRHWGESAAGSWKLTVADRAAGQVGVFAGWTLRIYGTPAAPVVISAGGPAADPVRPSAPAAPSSLAGSVSGTTLTLTWRASDSGSQPTSYAIEGGSSSGASNLLSARTTGPATSYTAAGLAAGTYFVRVRALNAFGTSAASNEIAVTVAAPASTAAATIAPAVNTTLLGASLTPAASSTAAAAAFSSTMSNAGGQAAAQNFAVQRVGSYGGAPQPFDSIPESERPAASTGSPGSERGTANERGTVAVADTTPMVETPASESERVAGPAAPNDLVASVKGSTIVLRWKAASRGTRATSFAVEAGSEPGGSNLFVASVDGRTLSFTAKDAEEGTYFVRVRASNAAGTSEPSNEASVVVGDAPACTAPPAAPGTPAAAANGSSVTWSWQAATGGATSYLLESASGPDSRNLAMSNTGNARTTLTLEGLAPGVHTARVRGRNACGSGPFSEASTVVIR